MPDTASASLLATERPRRTSARDSKLIGALAARDGVHHGLLGEAEDPHPTAVWALTKSYDERFVPGLLELLEHNLADPERELLCYNALLGIVNTGAASQQYEAKAMTAIEQASAHGHGSVAEAATQYLQVVRQR